MNNIEDIAKKIVDDAKGILAADESTNTIKKRFDSINIKSTKQTRCDYREILFSSNGMSKFISGVILFEETFFQKNKQGQSLKKILENANCFPGIKIDQGLEKLNNSPFETYTIGLETLNERLKPFVENGANVNAKTPIGWTPLIWAAFGENEKAAEYLLKRGANIK